MPAASGADVIRVLLLLGFVPAQRGVRVWKLQKHFSSVLVPQDDALLDPADLRALLRHADVAPGTFVELLTELCATG